MSFFPKNFQIWVFSLSVFAGAVARADSRVVFDAQIREIFRARCFKCHGDDEQKGDLNLQHYAAAMKGGSSGVAIVPGKPNSSPLFQAVTHVEGVEKMPPKSERIPDAEIEMIRAWITAGAPEKEGSAVRTVARLQMPEMGRERPVTPVMPVNLPVVERGGCPHPVTALAASPWAPLFARAVRDAVELRHADNGLLLGTLSFPEGIPFVLRFSRDGSRLMAAGGNAVSSGKVVLFDVRTGTRVAELGDENDAVLAADWSPDGKWVALGGSGRTVKVFATADGREVYRIRKHTDWITSIAFSPDSRYLATGDRAGGIHLWEPSSGAIVLSLSEHRDAIHALEWRADSRLLASASEDGSVIVWDAKDGWPAYTLSAGQPAVKIKRMRGGVLSVAWFGNGALSTVGRDRCVRVWSSDGEPLGASAPMDDLPTRIRALHAGDALCVGDAAGHVFRMEFHDGRLRLAPLLPEQP
jgi:WD40 repeat protein/mono/diheme cytochrome c family protein